jgi:phosphatidylinositol 4-kinase
LSTDAHLLALVLAAIDREPPDTRADIRDYRLLLQILVKDETFRVQTWLSPLVNDASVGPSVVEDANWPATVRAAWRIDPYLAVHLSERFVSASMNREIRRLILANPEDVIESAVAAQILLGESLPLDLRFQLKVRSLHTC